MNEQLIEFEMKTFEEKIRKMEKIQEEFNHELREQRDMLNAFDTTQQLILQKLDTIIETIDGLKAEHTAEKERPINNWEKVKWAVISTIITAIVTGIIAMIVG